MPMPVPVLLALPSAFAMSLPMPGLFAPTFAFDMPVIVCSSMEYQCLGHLLFGLRLLCL